MGAENVIVSMDKRGAVMVSGKVNIIVKKVHIAVIQQVRDSMVAGLFQNILSSDKQKAFSAVATGTAQHPVWVPKKRYNCIMRINFKVVILCNRRYGFSLSFLYRHLS